MDLQCQVCHGLIADGVCQDCSLQIPVTLGIPSFMPVSDVKHLVELYDQGSYDDLLRAFGKNFTVAVNPRLHQKTLDYHSQTAKRGKIFYDMVLSRLMREKLEWPKRTALVIGCGSGASLFPLASDYESVIGIDPSLGDLILARKAAQVAGIRNITLIHGIAQEIPLPNGSVDFIIAEDVLEHLGDLDLAFREMGRVLGPSGVFAGNCVNRFNLLRPEPHVQVWFLGCLPRSLQARYARWRSGVPNYDQMACLPSYRQLSRAMRHIGHSRITFPGMVAYEMPPALDGFFQGLENFPPIATPLKWIFPAWLAIASRNH